MQHTSQDNPYIRPTLPAHLQARLDAITARNKARFSGWFMEDGGGDGGSGDGGDGGGGDGGDGGSGDGGSGDGGDGDKKPGGDGDKDKGDKGGDAQDVSALPDWAQKLIKDTRSEAAEHRTGKTAAETKYEQTLDGIAKALGLKGDDKADPEKLSAELTKAQEAQRSAAVELTVYKKAATHQGDPDALLDSRSFLAKVADLDPAAKNFADKVDEAIKSALADNPKLKAQAAGKGGADLNGGSGESAKDKPKTLDAAVSKHYGN